MIQRLASRTRHSLRAFRRDTAGAMAVMVILLIPVMVGMMGLTVDVGIWYSHKRGMQDAVDAAALAGGIELANGGDTADVELAAEADADRNGFVDVTDTITVNVPPLTGPSVGDDGSVEVILSRSLPLFFTTLFLNEPYTAQVRAVVNTDFVDEFCILGLDPTESKAVEVTGTGTATLNCGIAVNSDADNALSVGGSASVTVTSVTTVGGVSILGGGDLNTDSAPRRGAAVEDPYADLVIPSFTGCDESTSTGPGGGLTVSGTVTLDASDPSNENSDIKVICGGLKVVAGADLTLEPGVYIIDQGDFEIAGGSTVTGTGVTIILTSLGAANKIGRLKITGGAEPTLSAPTSDPDGGPGFSGVLFYQDRDVSSNPSNSNLIAGGSDLDLQGALYFPGNDLDFAGGASLGSGCTQLIGKKVTITGDAGVQGTCDTAGTRSVGRLKASLGE